MKEYLADRKQGKKLYKRTRRKYKRYKYGIAVTIVILLAMAAVILKGLRMTTSMQEVKEYMLLAVGICIIFGIPALIAYAAAISGGREVLMSRMAEKCFFTEESFVLEYVPNAHETTEYARVQLRIRYEDIKRAVFEEQLCRIALYGSYRILKSRKGESDDFEASYSVSDLPMYIYGYYKDFEEIKEQIKKHILNSRCEF